MFQYHRGLSIRTVIPIFIRHQHNNNINLPTSLLTAAQRDVKKEKVTEMNRKNDLWIQTNHAITTPKNLKAFLSANHISSFFPLRLIVIPPLFV